jgi:hypothetical protein
LRLVQQGIGTGVLRQAEVGAAPANFLERLLVEMIPQWLPAVAPGKQLQALADAWNLGEGLLREPVWVDRYVNACCSRGMPRLEALAEFLATLLGPVLTPAPPAAWTGPLKVTTLDLRAAHDEFLPGRIRLAAPTVLCVEDRRKPGLQVGVLLRRGQRSESLGVVGGLGEYEEADPLPPVAFTDGKLKVGARVAEVPTLRACHAFAVARAGFVAAAAADSQRLWVIESE